MNFRTLTLTLALANICAASETIDLYYAWQLVPMEYYDEFLSTWKGARGSLLPLRDMHSRPVYASHLRAHRGNLTNTELNAENRYDPWAAALTFLIKPDPTSDPKDNANWVLPLCWTGTKWHATHHKCVLLEPGDAEPGLHERKHGYYQPTYAQAIAAGAGLGDGDIVSGFCPDEAPFGLQNLYGHTEGAVSTQGIEHEVWAEGCTKTPYTSDKMYIFRMIDILPDFNSFWLDVGGDWCPPCMWGLPDLFQTAAHIVKYNTPFVVTTGSQFGFTSTTMNAHTSQKLWKDMTQHLRRKGEQAPLFTVAFASRLKGGYPHYALVQPGMTDFLYKNPASNAWPGPPNNDEEDARLDYIASNLVAYFGESQDVATKMTRAYASQSNPAQLMRKEEIKATYQENQCCDQDSTCVVDFAPFHDAASHVTYCPVSEGTCDDHGFDKIEGMSECMAAYYSLSKSFHIFRESFSTERNFQMFMGPNMLECLRGKDGSEGQYSSHGFDNSQSGTFTIFSQAYGGSHITEKDADTFEISVALDNSHQVEEWNGKMGDVRTTNDLAGFTAMPVGEGSTTPFNGNGGSSYTMMIASPDGDVELCLAQQEFGNFGGGGTQGWRCKNIPQSNETMSYTWEVPGQDDKEVSRYGGLKVVFNKASSRDKRIWIHKEVFAKGTNTGGQRICKTKPGVTTCETHPVAQANMDAIPLCKNVWLSELSTWWETVEIASDSPGPCSLRGFLLSTENSDFWGQKGYRLDNSYVIPGVGNGKRGVSVLAIRHSEMIRLGQYINSGEPGFNSDGSANVHAGYRLRMQLKDNNDKIIDIMIIDRPAHMWTTGILSLQRASAHKDGRLMYAPNTMGFVNPTETWRTLDTVSYLLFTDNRSPEGADCTRQKTSNFDSYFTALYNVGSNVTCTWASDPGTSMITNPITPLRDTSDPNNLDALYAPLNVKNAYPIAEGTKLRFLALVPSELQVKFILTFGGQGFGRANTNGTKRHIITHIPPTEQQVAHEIELTSDMLVGVGGEPLTDIEMVVDQPMQYILIKHIAFVAPTPAPPPPPPPFPSPSAPVSAPLLPPASTSVTFSVDSFSFPGGITQSDTVYVSGTFNNWCGNCDPMSDLDGDGVWELTKAMMAGTHEYKFTANNWQNQEEFAQATPGCTVTDPSGVYTNRELTVVDGTDMVLETVYFNMCPQPFTIPASPTQHNVTLVFSDDGNWFSEVEVTVVCETPSGQDTVSFKCTDGRSRCSSKMFTAHTGALCIMRLHDSYGDGWNGGMTIKAFSDAYPTFNMLPSGATVYDGYGPDQDPCALSEQGCFAFLLPIPGSKVPSPPPPPASPLPMPPPPPPPATNVTVRMHPGCIDAGNGEIHWSVTCGDPEVDGFMVEAGGDTNLPAVSSFQVNTHVGQACTFVGKDLFGDGWHPTCIVQVDGDYDVKNLTFTESKRETSINFVIEFSMLYADPGFTYKFLSSTLEPEWKTPSRGYREFSHAISGTPSSGTGPQEQHPNEYGFLYTEASGGNDNTVFEIEYSCAPGQIAYRVDLEYHTLGDHLKPVRPDSEAYLEVLDEHDASIWRYHPVSQDLWQKKSYIQPGTNKFRIQARTGPGWSSDIAFTGVYVVCADDPCADKSLEFVSPAFPSGGALNDAIINCPSCTDTVLLAAANNTAVGGVERCDRFIEEFVLSTSVQAAISALGITLTSGSAVCNAPLSLGQSLLGGSLFSLQWNYPPDYTATSKFYEVCPTTCATYSVGSDCI